MSLTPFNLGAVGVYLVVVFAVGILAGRHQTFESYWVNRRRTGFLILLASLVSTQVGAGAVIGLSSAAYDSGIGYPLVALVSTIGGFLLVGLLAPRIKRFGDEHRAITISEYLGVRYGRSTERLGGLVVLLGYLSFLAAQFLAIARLIDELTALEFVPALILTSVALVLYTSYAGIRGDFLTDFLHFLVMLVALPFLASALAPLWGGTLPFPLPVSHWSPVSFGGWGFLLGGLFFGLILGLSSMELWQRIYSAKGPSQARAVFFVGALCIVPFYIVFSGLGLLARGLLGPSAQPDSVLYPLLGSVLPTGLQGVAIAALAAAFLSTANSMILVLSGTIGRNFLRVGGDDVDSTEGRGLRLSRWISLGVGAIGLSLALLVPNIVQLTLNAFYLIGLIAPPLIGGMLWRRPTRGIANASIILGLLATICALPFSPRQAFLVAALVAIPVFFVGSLLRRTRSRTMDAGSPYVP